MKFFIQAVFILSILSTNVSAQSNHEQDSLRFVTSYTVTKQQIKTISFEASIDRKKALSAILGKTRHFKVFAVRNPSNKGYNFDWQITESNNPIENKTFFFEEDHFFEVNEKEKEIKVVESIRKLADDDELEILRSYLLPDELLYGIMEKQSTSCTFEDDGEHFKMYNQEADDLLRIVCYNKNNLFPENTDLIQSYPNMSALDITSVRLNKIMINEILPKEVISFEHYLDQDYEIVSSTEIAAAVEPSPIPEQVQQSRAQAQVPQQQKEYQQQAPQQKHHQKELALSQSKVNSLLKTELETGKGWETTIGKFHDKSYLLLDFWFASSTTSMEDLPAVQSIHRDFRKKGLRVFGVNCQDYDQKKTVVKKLKQKGITFTTLFGKSINLKKWGIENIPAYVLLDEDGKIVLQGSSEILEELRDYLETVN